MNNNVVVGGAKAQWEMISEELVKQYYHLFDNSREQLVALYSPDAMFTFEEHKVQGQPAIKDVITEKLRFQKIQHVVTKVDSQPTPDNGMIVLVTGRLKTDDDLPHGFSQTFYVKPLNGSFFICHSIFRLSIHDH